MLNNHKIGGKLFFLLLIILIFGGCGKKDKTELPLDGYYANDGDFDASKFTIIPEEFFIDIDETEKAERQIVVLAISVPEGSENYYNEWNYLITSFNSISDKYYVELVEYVNGYDRSDAMQKLLVEIGAGGGPDIIYGDLIDVTQSMLDEGVFVDMSEYMTYYGITSEKYFPGYADYIYEGGIYALCPSIDVVSVAVKSDVIDSNDITIDEYLDALLEYEEKAAFIYAGQDGGSVLDYFLCGSEDLWGIIDWENGTCDFSSELFDKMLKVSKRYADDGINGYEPIMSYLYTLTGIYESRESTELQGNIVIDYFFDDGNHPVYHDGHDVMINSNSDNIDGAWAFLSYVMSKNGQNYVGNPVNREVFLDEAQYIIGMIEEGVTNMILDDELVEELVCIYNDARYLPKKTDVIREIIYEETEQYFTNDKSIEEVKVIIQSRVQLYLNENK